MSPVSSNLDTGCGQGGFAALPFGKVKVDNFPPVVASKVRLYVATATGSPAIDEFAVFKTKTSATE